MKKLITQQHIDNGRKGYHYARGRNHYSVQSRIYHR